MWRNGRLFIISGDPNQICPTTLSKNAKFTSPSGTLLQANPFHLNHSESFHTAVISRGWQQYVISEQMRICPGGFDLSKSVSYKGWDIQYSPSNTVQSHKWSAACEKLAVVMGARPSPSGVVYPIFIDYPGTAACVVNEKTKSSSNELSYAACVGVINVLQAHVPEVIAADVMVVCPNSGQKVKWTNWLKLQASLHPDARSTITTVDGCQCGEAEIVILDLIRDSGVGLGFLTDKNRLNVACTCHKSFLFVVGDSKIASNMRNSSLFEWLRWFGLFDRRVDGVTAAR